MNNRQYATGQHARSKSLACCILPIAKSMT
jgi:hypothetical protein